MNGIWTAEEQRESVIAWRRKIEAENVANDQIRREMIEQREIEKQRGAAGPAGAGAAAVFQGGETHEDATNQGDFGHP